MKTLILDSETKRIGHKNEHNNAQWLFVRNQSCTLFKRMMLQGKLRRFINHFTRKSSLLVSLSSEIQPEDTHSIFEYGLQAVPLCKIIGSENRCHDFDNQFAPRSFHLLERWIRLSDLFFMDEIIPPVELIQVGDFYFVRDGHHRISVAKALGKEYIDACVKIIQLKEDVADQLSRYFHRVVSERVYLN